MKAGGKILLAALGLVVAAGLLYIADWLWAGATVRGDALRAFEMKDAEGGADSAFYFQEGDADLRLGIPGVFHNFRQAVVVLKYSYEADRVVYQEEEEEGWEEPYEDFDEDEYEYEYSEEDAGGYAYEGEPDDIEDDWEDGAEPEEEPYEQDGYAEEDGWEYDETEGEEDYLDGDGMEYAEGDGEEPDEEYTDETEEGGEETYTTERVTTNALAMVWLEFRNWRWQIVNADFLYE